MVIDPIFFRGLVNVTIPAVYSDALTYEEQIAILTAKINEIIADFNSLSDDEIQELIDNYLTPEKIQELLDGAFGEYVSTAITENNEYYYTKTQTDDEISGAVAREAQTRSTNDENLSSDLTRQINAVADDLAGNYYTKSQTEEKITEAIPSDYVTIQDVNDIVDTGIAAEVVNRNSAISTAISNNNANYYTKSQVDGKQSADRAYTDIAVSDVQTNLNAKLALVETSCYSVDNANTWQNYYNNVNGKYSDYNAAVTSDVSNLFLDFSFNAINDNQGIIHLHGYFTPISASTINPTAATGFLFVPFKVVSEMTILATVQNISDGVTIQVPMKLKPTEGNDSILAYNSVNSDVTPGFSATGKRIYIDTSAMFVAHN